MSPALTGAFLDIVVVENLDDSTNETETIIGQTTDDIEVERDTEDAEWQEHNNDVMQRKELAASQDLSFSMIITDDRQNLQDAGLLDADGAIKKNVVHEAVRLNIFNDPSDAEPSTVFELRDTQFKYETTDLPIDGVGVVEVTGWVNGDMRFTA